MKGVYQMNNETRLGEVKATLEDMVVEGYALKFDTYSEDLGGFIETISRTALDTTDFSDVRCFVDHDTSKILGRTIAETLQLEVDGIGLKFKCFFPETTLGRDTFESVKRGDLSQMSFAFEIAKDGDRISYRNGIYIRELLNIKRITEISIVSMPAYTDTDISIAKRKIEHVRHNERFIALLELERPI